MTTTGQNITVWEGEDKNIQITVRTRRVGGAPVNLTGSTVTWVVTTGADSNTAIISKTSTAGEITFDDDGGTNNRANIALLAADTQTLEGRTLYHECRVEDVAGDDAVVATGIFRIKNSSTG